MFYNNNSSNKTLYSRTFYVLYIGPNDSSASHLVFKLSTKQLLTTSQCKPVPMPKEIIQAVYEMGTITNKIHLYHFDRDHQKSQQNHFGTTHDDNQEHYVSIKNCDHESDGHLNKSQKIDGTNSDTRFPHTNGILQTVGPSISTIFSMECTSTDISTNFF